VHAPFLARKPARRWTTGCAPDEKDRRPGAPAGRQFILLFVVSFPVGLLFGRFVLGDSWDLATGPGFDAMLITVFAAAVPALGRIAFAALVRRAERTPSD
jgi:hypothetical protein